MVFYRLLFLLLLPLLLMVAPLFSRKVRQGLSLRIYPRPPPKWLGEDPTIWIHCASGEFEYAKPLIRHWKAHAPQMKIVVSYFSPTYAKNIENFPGVDWSLPLPLDLPGPCRSMISKVKPKLVLIARTDLWPEFLWQCQRLNIPTILFAATARSKKGLLGLPSSVTKWRFMLLTQIYCVSEEDETLLRAISPSLKIEALGDTRYDQVKERLNHPKQLHEHLKPSPDLPTLVAGSTWAEDEKVLVQAITPLLKDHRLNLVIAPHEPTSKNLTKLTRLLKSYQLPYQFYSDATSFVPGTVLIIDQVGILAELYQWGHLAFVGGSFRGSVHSVMEPIAAGCLTAVGPYHLNNREAGELKEVQTLEGHRLVSALQDQSDLRLWLTSLIDLPPEQWQVIRDHLTAQIDRRSGATLRLFNQLKSYF